MHQKNCEHMDKYGCSQVELRAKFVFHFVLRILIRLVKLHRNSVVFTSKNSSVVEKNAKHWADRKPRKSFHFPKAFYSFLLSALHGWSLLFSDLPFKTESRGVILGSQTLKPNFSQGLKQAGLKAWHPRPVHVTVHSDRRTSKMNSRAN